MPSIQADTARKLYAQYECEGRATYSVSDGMATLPFVDTVNGVMAMTLQMLPSAPATQFKVKSSQVAVPAVNPVLKPCHASLSNDGTLHIPFIDAPALNSLVNVTLVQNAADSTTFNLADVQPIQLARLEPLAGTYFGINMDWSTDTIEGVGGRLGFNPDIFIVFLSFPFDTEGSKWVDQVTTKLKAINGIMLLTLEPYKGLAAITPQVAADFAQQMKKSNDQGVPIIVRFAHEMNGSWYPWGQNPTEYISAFRLLADAVHKTTPSTAMLWAPNLGSGYPFTGGQYQAQPNTPKFTALDTNHDGKLDSYDDPYAPYYPGDDVVDWVGMSLYHWSDHRPWTTNTIPEIDKFVGQLRSTYVGDNGDDRMVPDFYGIYAEKKQKPMAITETAALFMPSATGDNERLIKQLWWRQVFSPEARARLPRLKMINWFEQRKNEGELNGNLADWRVTATPEMAQAFAKDLRKAWVGLSALTAKFSQ